LKIAAESSFYHADLLKNMGKNDDAIKEFNALIDRYPDQDQWSVTAFAHIAECYENEKKFNDAYKTYQRILAFTKVKRYRTEAQRRMAILKKIIAAEKKTKPHKAKKPVTTPEDAP